MARERAKHVGIRALAWIVVVVIVAVLAAQWFRPVPAPAFVSTVPPLVHLPGPRPALPFPPSGASALVAVGAGSLGHGGATTPVPIAGLTKVMTAYVVLLDHPLAPGDDGPPIRVTPQIMAASQQQQAAQQSVVPMAAGEILSELQALQGLLVAQGNNVATLLTAWDATTTGAFVAKMNHTARALGLRSTTFTDANGVAPGSVSTPGDMIRLGEAAMAVPVFRQVVGMPQATLPLAGTVYNFDYDLGHDGFVGIKTGSDNAAGGCFLFEAQHTVGGTTVSVMGAVLGESGTSPLTAALYDADILVRAAFASLASIPVVPAGQHVGQLVAAWGRSVPVTAAPSAVVGWPGLVARVQARTAQVSRGIGPGSTVGVFTIQLGDQRVSVSLQTSRALAGPSTVWRLTRL